MQCCLHLEGVFGGFISPVKFKVKSCLESSNLKLRRIGVRLTGAQKKGIECRVRFDLIWHHPYIW